MREVIYDVEWQKLRISTLQGFGESTWSTIEGSQDNLNRLYDYLYAADAFSDEHSVRTYRVNNMLNAVCMGYFGQGANDQLRLHVQEWRQRHAYSWSNAAVSKVATTWDWDKVKEDIKTLTDKEYNFLFRDLKKRMKNGSEATRPELYKFVKIMAENP